MRNQLSFEPHLLLYFHLEAGYTFAPFGGGTESGYCRTITWELGYLGSLSSPCDVDRLCDRNAWQIKELAVVVMTDGNDDNRLQRCACVCRTSLGGPFRGNDSDHGDWTARLWGQPDGLL